MQLLNKLKSLGPLLMLCAAQEAMAAHPMVTDDTQTQGTGKNQLEINSDRVTQWDDSNQTVGDVTYTYGLTDSVDLIADQPSVLTNPRGLGDTSLGAKWRFYENGNTSVGLKSGVSLADANAKKGFGSGRNNLAMLLIVSHVSGNWDFNYNLGMTTNRFKYRSIQAANRKQLWLLSTATTYALTPKLKLAGDLVITSNPDVTSRQYPAFAIAGLIYSPVNSIDIDVGLRMGLTDVAIKHQYGAGLTLRF